MTLNDAHTTDAGGPTLFHELAQELRELGKEKFGDKYGQGFLLFHGADLSGRSPSDTQVPAGRANTASSTFHVFLLRKRTENGHAFATLGRTSDNDLVVEDDTISRFHAGFEENAGAWRVFDMGSRNGTFVGDEAVPKEAVGSLPLAPRAQLRFGSVQMKFMPLEDFVQFAEAFVGPIT